MDLSRVDENLQDLETLGFITNCSPHKNLTIKHDHIEKYCNLLNDKAALVAEHRFKSIHLNEPVGDYIAIYKPGFRQLALDSLNTEANSDSHKFGYSRKW